MGAAVPGRGSPARKVPRGNGCGAAGDLEPGPWLLRRNQISKVRACRGRRAGQLGVVARQ